MNITFLSLFEKNERQFRNELSILKLPKDIDKLQSFLNDFFVNKVSVDEYKNELTMAEVAMLNSVLRIVSTPLALVNEWTVLNVKDCSSQNNTEEGNKQDENQSFAKKINMPVVGATAAGGIIGGLLFKTWGGVLLSIAGCALGMYFSSNRNEQRQCEKVIQQQEASLDVEKYIDTLKRICLGIDDIMDNYQAGISNIEKLYTSKPNPTFASTYKPILDRMASLYVAINNANLPSDVQTEFDKLYRTLKNHHYEVLGYSEENRQYFVEMPSAHVSEVTIIKAAILEDGKLIEAGECLVPENNSDK